MIARAIFTLTLDYVCDAAEAFFCQPRSYISLWCLVFPGSALFLTKTSNITSQYQSQVHYIYLLPRVVVKAKKSTGSDRITAENALRHGLSQTLASFVAGRVAVDATENITAAAGASSHRVMKLVCPGLLQQHHAVTTAPLSSPVGNRSCNAMGYSTIKMDYD